MDAATFSMLHRFAAPFQIIAPTRFAEKTVPLPRWISTTPSECSEALTSGATRNLKRPGSSSFGVLCAAPVPEKTHHVRNSTPCDVLSGRVLGYGAYSLLADMNFDYGAVAFRGNRKIRRKDARDRGTDVTGLRFWADFDSVNGRQGSAPRIGACPDGRVSALCGESRLSPSVNTCTQAGPRKKAVRFHRSRRWPRRRTDISGWAPARA